MPSEYSLSGTGWNASDFGRAPDSSDVEIKCDGCGAMTTTDKLDGWEHETDLETYHTTIFCPECGSE